jgi:hypothetical protein
MNGSDACDEGKSPGRKRLSATAVTRIFIRKGGPCNAREVAKEYGISEKAVRDIWTGRTWKKETRLLVCSSLDVLQKPNARQGSQPLARKPRDIQIKDDASVDKTLDVTRQAEADELGNDSEPSTGRHKMEDDKATRPMPGKDTTALLFKPEAAAVRSLDVQLHSWEGQFKTAPDFHDPFHQDLKALQSNIRPR